MSVKKLARRLPSPIYRALRRIHQRIVKPQPTQISTPNPGPMYTNAVPRLAAIPGWFNIDDLAHFSLVLETQTTGGIHGDLLEIGCYHGRSAAVLAMHLQASECLFLADAFDLPLDDPYGDTPTPQQVWQNLVNAVPDLPRERVSIQRAYSNDLQLPPGTNLRFAHIDGGHDATTVGEDLSFCAKYLMPGGVIAIDDFAHPQYPGVTEAVNKFLGCQASFRILADLNRSGALGRKLYLARNMERA